MPYSLASPRFAALALPNSWRRLALALLLGAPLAAAAQTPFACTAGKSYLFQGDATTAVEIDLSTGTSKPASSPIIPAADGNQKLNAFGYNPLDNYVWGQRTNTSQVVRVGSDYVGTAYPVSGLTDDVTAAVVGDVSPSGVMYLTRGGSSAGGSGASEAQRAIYAIDLTKLPLTASRLPVVPPATYLTDWAVSPVDGNIYALYSYFAGTNAVALTLYRYITAPSTTAGTRQELGAVVAGPTASRDGQDFPIAASNFGAAFMDSQGNFYVVANETGYIYRIDTPHISGSLTAHYVASAPLKSVNLNTDGARCPATAVAPLPVQLTAFSAAAAPGRSVQLAWTTASEVNSSFFDVQHSLDGRTFAAVGQVAAHGNTQAVSNYTFLHAAPGAAATHYYRLRQVDQDGTSAFGPVQVVTLAAGTSAAQLTVAPNPVAAGRLQVQVQYAGAAPATATLTVRTALGQALWAQPVTLQPGANALTAGALLAPGVYWLALSGDARVGTQGTRVVVGN